LNQCHLDISGKILSAAGVPVLNDLGAFFTSFFSLSSPLPTPCLTSFPLFWCCMDLHAFTLLFASKLFHFFLFIRFVNNSLS